MKWFRNLFKSSHYTSEIDALLMKLNKKSAYDTTGKTAKISYYQALIKKRDTQ